MAIYRPITAVLSAIFTGLLVATSAEPKQNTTTAAKSCCSSKAEVEVPKKESSCCASKQATKVTVTSKTLAGLKYGATQLVDDLIKWLLVGLLFATIVRTFVPTAFLLSYGSGLSAMIVMIAMSVPMYICATASTPIAAGFIMAGISPGTALVFMMAGPATNISTLGVIKNEMGTQVLIKYLLGITISAIGFGLLLDWGLNTFVIDISEQMQHSHEILPQWFGLTCSAIIVFLAIKPLRKLLI